MINYTRGIAINGISKFQVDIESNWNSRIDNVYANIFFSKGSNSSSFVSFKTPSTSLEQWSTGMLEGFFDTGNFTAGIYNANITLLYAGNSSNSVVSVEFYRKGSRFTTGIIAAVVIAVIIIILLLRKFMLKNAEEKRREKRKGKKRE